MLESRLHADLDAHRDMRSWGRSLRTPYFYFKESIIHILNITQAAQWHSLTERDSYKSQLVFLAKLPWMHIMPAIKETAVTPAAAFTFITPLNTLLCSCACRRPIEGPSIANIFPHATRFPWKCWIQPCTQSLNQVFNYHFIPIFSVPYENIIHALLHTLGQNTLWTGFHKQKDRQFVEPGCTAVCTGDFLPLSPNFLSSEEDTEKQSGTAFWPWIEIHIQQYRSLWDSVFFRPESVTHLSLQVIHCWKAHSIVTTRFIGGLIALTSTTPGQVYICTTVWQYSIFQMLWFGFRKGLQSTTWKKTIEDMSPKASPLTLYKSPSYHALSLFDNQKDLEHVPTNSVHSRSHPLILRITGHHWSTAAAATPCNHPLPNSPQGSFLQTFSCAGAPLATPGLLVSRT